MFNKIPENDKSQHKIYCRLVPPLLLPATGRDDRCRQTFWLLLKVVLVLVVVPVLPVLVVLVLLEVLLLVIPLLR